LIKRKFSTSSEAYLRRWIVSGGECERRSIRVRLGGNSYPISAMSGAHHCYG